MHPLQGITVVAVEQAVAEPICTRIPGFAGMPAKPGMPIADIGAGM